MSEKAGKRTGRDQTAMFCVCREHVELAIDKFVDRYEDAPDLIDAKAAAQAGGQLPDRCEWCERPAEILVAHRDENVWAAKETE